MKVVIDTNKWTTQWQYAKMKKVSRQVVKNWINRKRVETKYIEELDLMLIKVNYELKER